jgi:DHA1 family inner membrane transport protein
MTGTVNKDSRAFFPALVVAISSIDSPSLVLNVGLIDVAATFGVSLSLAGQIQSVTSSIGIAAALVMGVVSARFSYKRLLLSGLALTVVSALLCSYAPTFSLLIISYSLVGIVVSIVGPMVFAYLGEHYPKAERSKAVGLLAALRTVIYLGVIQVINYVVGAFGWRATYLVLVAPLAIVGFVSVFKVLPDLRAGEGNQNHDLLQGYRSVLGSRSAIANLIGNSLSAASWAGGVVLYTVSFLRDKYQLQRGDAALIFSGLVVGVILGNYVGGLVAMRIGRKKTVVITSLSTGLLIMVYTNISNLTLAVLIMMVMSLFAGMVLTAANTLILEQVPSYRGTITSVNSAASQLGNAFGAAAGGLALQLSGWGLVGITLGFLQLLASLIYQLGVSKPESIGKVHE